MIIFSQFPIFTIATILALVGALILALIRKWVAVHLLTSHHEVAFPIFLQIGVIYAVLIAFLFSMVLTQLDEAHTEVKVEASTLLTLAQMAQGFPNEMRQKIDNELIQYTESVVNKEWPKMGQGKEAPECSQSLARLQKIYFNFNPSSIREQILYDHSLQHFEQMRESHRVRIFTASEPRLQNPMLMLTLLGLIIVIISYFFGMHRLWTQMFLTGALIFTITSVLIAIFMVRNPFHGRFGIKSTIFQSTLVRLEQVSKEQL